MIKNAIKYLLEKLLKVTGILSILKSTRKFFVIDVLNEQSKNFDKHINLKKIAYTKSFHETYNVLKEDIEKSFLFDLRDEIHDFTIKKIRENNNTDKLLLEFGVWKGRSINYFAEKLSNYKIYGFDSFEGLSEVWLGKLDKGSFNEKGNIPKVKGNVIIIKGLIEKTLPNFIKNKNNTISFVHIDTDTYSSQKFILKTIKKNLSSGSYILFDDLVCYPSWKNGGFKALNEVFSKKEYEYIAFAEKSALIKIN
tara:strand:- start:264 stop:1019 length:756 start_codon:yes stop_codon:yes gene_type:complete